MPIADTSNYNTEDITTRGLGLKVDSMMQMVEMQRRNFERHWYDNTFFDDGYHFRYISRTTGKIIDASDKGNLNAPTRAIPKASRQIRGVANLLLQPDYIPVIYPERITKVNYPDPQEYQQALEAASTTARKLGSWIQEEWKAQHLQEKMMLMVLLAAKHSVSFLQIWPDAVEEKIRTQVYDAFEIFLPGNLNSIYDSPFIIKAAPQLISKIKANENFDPEALTKLSPDNKYASSELKQAYMQSRFGTSSNPDVAATLIQKELFAKEYLSERNFNDVQEKGQKHRVLEGKKMGDMVMRHAFTAGGVTLLDEYVSLKDYPFVDFRMEPGPIYQVPLIERFMPANKTLDIVASRVERYINTMVSGTWLTRKGEDLQITNIPGGQKLEYTTTAPIQAPQAPIPSYVFNFMEFLEKSIEEGGASTSALNQLPSGVKSGTAIESVKATEYANLKIASNQLKETIRRISENMIDIADSHFINPQTVYLLKEGKPSYFDIIGQAGVEARQKLGMNVPEAIPIKDEYLVDIEVESGLGFTEEGRKKTLQEIVSFLTPFVTNGLFTTDAAKILIQQVLNQYGFGATQDLIEGLDTGTQTAPLTGDQIMQMKVAMIEAMKDAGVVGPQKDQQLVNSTKVGVVEALRDTGMVNKQDNSSVNKISESMSYKDVNPDIKRQMEQAAGFTPSTMRDPQPTKPVSSSN